MSAKSFIVALFNTQKSTHRLKVLSFLSTKNIGAPIGEFDGRIKPIFNISLIYSLSAFFSFSDNVKIGLSGESFSGL